MENGINQTRKYLYGHTSPETAYVVEDYPWGFRLRTTIRYWIESKSGKAGGQRFVSQTINPKTGIWCAPKKSTYSPLMVMFLNENDHVHCESLSTNADETKINKFKETHLAFLDDFQKETLKEVMAFSKVMEQVTFTVTRSKYGSVSLFSRDPEEIEKRKLIAAEQEENKKRKEETLKNINRAIAYEYSKINI